MRPQQGAEHEHTEHLIGKEQLLPVVLHGDLFPLLDVLLGLHPDVLVAVHTKPGISYAAVVKKGKCGVNCTATQS